MANVLGSRENLSEGDRRNIKALLAESRTLASEGELQTSLKCLKKAYKICPSEKIQNRINKLEDLLSSHDDEDEDFGFVELDNGLVIYKDLVQRLYPHQIIGVKWMYDLFKSKRKGGILADDMGLGKTIQVISFLSAMFDMRLIKSVLLVIPMSVIPNWQAEFKKWSPGIQVECFHGAVGKRKAILQQCMMKRSVCITTYGLIVTQWQSLGVTLHGTEFVWDYIILDEGHRIKNPTKTTKRLHSIPSKNRIILTGTPVQNKVRDMWALMDWVTQGSVLGTQKTFCSNYETPIERARQRDASAAQIQHGNSMAVSLRKLTDPYILRRTKAGLTASDKENISSVDKNLQRSLVDKGQDPSTISKQPTFPKLSTKNDFVCWVYLSEIQQKIYKDFLELDSVKELLTSHKSPLVHLTILKKICDHPRLLSNKACVELGLQPNNASLSLDLNSSTIEDCAANKIDNIADSTLMEESGKLQFLIQLLLRLREEGHRTLVFSMSRKMLNIIQRILMNHRFKIMRLDGRITKMSERAIRVKKFQEDPTFDVFLLTTQVGGVGLTLTAADRVVIYDPAWNPATDDQAIDRIYRIGQTKSVAVYRLITCGSVEEKIYRRQVFKNSVIQQSVHGKKDPYRYFTSQELKELFILDDVTSSNTQLQLEQLHGDQRKIDEELQVHLDYIKTLQMFGTSDHDLMFTCKPDDFDYDAQMAGTDSHPMVQEAHNKIQAEVGQFTGHDVIDLRWGGFQEEKRETAPPRVDNEPVYPIGEISSKLSDMKFSPKYENKTRFEDRGDLNMPNIKMELPDKWRDVTDDIGQSAEQNRRRSNFADLRSTKHDSDVITIDSASSSPRNEASELERPFTEKSYPHLQTMFIEESPVNSSHSSPVGKKYPDDGTQEINKPTVIEESFDLYEAQSSSDEGNPDEWKEAFGDTSRIGSNRGTPVSSLRHHNFSYEDSPLVAPGNRKKKNLISIESSSSDDSADELPSAFDILNTSHASATSSRHSTGRSRDASMRYQDRERSVSGAGNHRSSTDEESLPGTAGKGVTLPNDFEDDLVSDDVRNDVTNFSDEEEEDRFADESSTEEDESRDSFHGRAAMLEDEALDDSNATHEYYSDEQQEESHEEPIFNIGSSDEDDYDSPTSLLPRPL